MSRRGQREVTSPVFSRLVGKWLCHFRVVGLRLTLLLCSLAPWPIRFLLNILYIPCSLHNEWYVSRICQPWKRRNEKILQKTNEWYIEELLHAIAYDCVPSFDFISAVHIWFIHIHHFHGNIWTYNWPAPNVSGFIAQLVRASHRLENICTYFRPWTGRNFVGSYLVFSDARLCTGHKPHRANMSPLWLPASLDASLARTKTHVLVLCCCRLLGALCVFSSAFSDRREDWKQSPDVIYRGRHRRLLWFIEDAIVDWDLVSEVPVSFDLLGFLSFPRATHSPLRCVKLLAQDPWRSLL